MSKILIGISGFYYEDWVGSFYPPALAKKDFLAFYSKAFSTLELNFTYYRLPKASQAEQMIDRSGGRLTFVVKAYRGITHEISDISLKETLSLFLDGISPFMEKGSLGAVLLQFPQSFHYTTKNRIYLKSLIENLSSYPLFVEFRHRDWIRDSVFETLKTLGAGFVCVDEPPLPSLIPPMAIHTSNMGYVRFHGRNKKDWYGTDAMTRYDYLYTDHELREWLPRIKEMAGQTDKLFVFFNNHAKAQAITNANMLINLLK
jgi:uncharacterized protein YecE (DUF72 family)